MGDKKITNFDPANALATNDIVPVVQNGFTRRSTAAAFTTLANTDRRALLSTTVAAGATATIALPPNSTTSTLLGTLRANTGFALYGLAWNTSNSTWIVYEIFRDSTFTTINARFVDTGSPTQIGITHDSAGSQFFAISASKL